MQLDQALTHVAVLGAAGKMGSGIALLILQEMARLQLENNGKKDPASYVLKLIDINETAFPALREYLRDQLLKYAEKNINSLRQQYAQNKSLISNEEIIQAYVREALDLVFFETELEAAKNANLVFEAILENVELKAQALRTIADQSHHKGFFLTNTSSIPIQVLNEKAKLNNRVIGFHFYNPPAIQKLLEIIASPETDSTLINIANELAKRLKKIVVHSKDEAGFIGNGHMMREVVFACKKVEELSRDYSLEESIYLINRVTQDWLVRPMGIFQLMDYVGLDVCQHIGHIMRTYLKDPSLKVELIDRIVKNGVLGGQNPDGTQKNGFFSYSKHAIQGIYSLQKSSYIPLSDIHVDHVLGDLPKGHLSWKAMQKEANKTFLLKSYFENLNAQNTWGSELAQDFLHHSFAIANKLVADGVAASLSDIDKVLIHGFYHLYGTKV